jgi:general secretion pathway protein M
MTLWQPVLSWWGRLAGRERGLVAMMLVIVVAAVLWFVGVAPALRTLRSAPSQIAALDAQWQSLQGLALEARSLQGRAPLGRDEAVRELEQSARQRLGTSAQVTATADRVTVVLRGAPPQGMAAWLSQARLKARAVATQANLTRGPAGWDGTLVLNLPPAP